MRKRKKEFKAAHKALTTAGLTETAEEHTISKEWFSLLRQHNKLRTVLNKKKHQKEKMAAELKFRHHNPNQFENTLFNHNKQAGIPDFTADVAHTYFQKVYSDEQRSYTYTQLPDIPRPELPSKVFHTNSPSFSELQKSVKRKRNGAARGFNSLTYVPYKKCVSILK